MLNKMPGYPDDKFKNLKAAYAFMIFHPGKKLLFMGQDFGQLREWSEERELDWYLLKEDNHKDLQNFVKTLFHMYKKYPALYAGDNDPEGFEWINADDADRSIFSLVRLLDKPKVFKAEAQECDHREFSFAYPLPAYGVAVFTY